MTKEAGGDHEAKRMRVLEINLISAQGLKLSSANLRRMQTYAVVWVDSATKLRTRIDRVGAENPTWNDKFLFRVSPEFLSGETSAVSVQIFSVGCLRDHLIGTVRFLLSNVIAFGRAVGTPAFTAVQIRRPSGRFQGVLNIGAMVIDGSEFSTLNGTSAIGYRDLMGESLRRRRDSHGRNKSKAKGGESCSENSCAESAEYSDGESSTSSSSTASTVLRDWNGIRDLAGTKTLRASNGAGLLCGLLIQRKIHLSPSDENFHSFGGSLETKR